MERDNQHNKEITIPLERTDLGRIILIAALAVGGIAFLFDKDTVPISFAFWLIAVFAGGLHASIRKNMRKVEICADRLRLFSRSGKLIREYLFADVKIVRREVSVNERFRMEKHDAMILCRDAEPYGSIFLDKYKNNRDVLIITNRNAICVLEARLEIFSERSTKPLSEKPVCSNEIEYRYSLLSNDISAPRLITMKHLLFLVYIVCFPLLLSLVSAIFLLFLIPAAMLVCFSAHLHYSRRRYQRNALVTKTKVSVYSRSGNHLRDFYFSEVQAVKCSFYMEGVYFAQEADCLILFCGPTLPDKESFEKYWKNKDILFTNNPQLISVLEELVPDKQFLEHKHEMS